MRVIAFLAALVALGLFGTVGAVEVDCPKPRLADCGSEGNPPSSQGTPDDPEEPGGGKHPNAGRGNGPEGDPDEDPGNSGGRNRGGD